MKRITIFHSIFFLILFVSCNEKGSSVFTLKENEVITYINEAPRDETEIISIKISSVKTEGNFTHAKLSSNPFFGKKDSELNVKIDERTGEVYTIENGSEALLFPGAKDLRKGYSWEYNGYNAVITSTGEKVKGESQNFENCIRIDYRLSITFNSEIWLKPGVGIVRFAAYRTNPPSLSHTYYVWKN